MSTELSPQLHQAIINSFQHAKKELHEAVTPEHLLLQMLDEPAALKILNAVQADIEAFRKELKEYLEENIPKFPQKKDTEPSPTSNFAKLLQFALFQVRASGGKREADIPEVLIAMFSLKDTFAVNLMASQNISRLDVVNFVTHGLKKGEEQLPMQAAEGEDGEDAEKQANPLAQFTTNLNKSATEGKIDSLIGREEEVERVVQILCRRRKNNPILVGDPGVGKTAIAEGLAKRIVEGNVPSVLKDYEILSLDLGSLVAGTKYRGDFESRIKAVIKAIAKDPKKILFVDEIHALIGAGAASGGNLDAANLFKPALSRGEMRCIGATTYKEYRGIFEADHALSRRFQKVDVNEPSLENSIKILQGAKGSYEKHHGVTYTDDAIEAAVRLSSRYINDRLLPDKAIDVIDEAGAIQRTLPEGMGKTIIATADIEKIVAKIAGVPVGTVSENDKHRIKHLGADLDATVFGQETATKAVAKSVLLNRSGLGKANKPVGAYLFTGPTGVGKTELCKQLANTLGLELIRFDMSEYMEKHSVSRLIGAPPGYVGHDEGGQLIEIINKKPHAVLLLDEIEKAHPDVFNALLQVFDNATMTDGKGRKADFRNTIIVMTTNVGAALAAGKRSIGFGNDPGSASREAMEGALKSTFSPEFRNRLDGVITFKGIDQNVIAKIVDKNLAQLDQELRSRKPPVSVIFSDGLRGHLAVKGFDPAMGARPMERLINDTIRTQLAEELLFGKLEHGGEVEMDVSDGPDGEKQVTYNVTVSNPDPAVPASAAPAAKKAKITRTRS
jgi:ATP-dependent Clp protease ATP-binding subunit ClpA